MGCSRELPDGPREGLRPVQRDERATVVDLDEPPSGQELGAAPAVRGPAARV
ncbi:hypothetical protein AB9Q10_09660 [Streptomyces krungchingensis]|uniref:hypothetical protein n=1 Tax=Streptomyces krungchingensis TaxID=1565034 RepID=UPI003CFB9754